MKDVFKELTVRLATEQNCSGSVGKCENECRKYNVYIQH